jgi:tRNA-Thr(GGU) m(6)t(6)A37 methyltransferase TsaA
MESHFQSMAIGSIRSKEKDFCIQIDQPYIPALTNLEGFSHLQVVWWAHLTDSSQHRETLIAKKLFKKGPDQLGIFATRAPARPNPIMISTIHVAGVDFDKGVIQTHFIDADDGTPVLDIKPYFPMERVKDPQVPAWCRHWPAWQEETMNFSWQDEINREEL